jgi:hypothetical protein
LLQYNNKFKVDHSSLKTLYNIQISDEPVINFTNQVSNRYYKVSNLESGYDKKFDCIFSITNNNINSIYDNLYLINNKNCKVFNYINIPFIFDNKVSILKENNPILFDSTNLTGIFLLNLNDFSYSTTITETKDSVPNLIGIVGGMFSSLLTAFMFLKSKKWQHDNKVELNRRNTVDKTEPNPASDVKYESEYTDYYKDKINIELCKIRLEN